MGQVLASQCSEFLCFILNLIILETNRLYLIYPYIQNEFKKLPVPLSMLNYNYVDRLGNLMYINWPIFIQLTHIYIYI